MDFVSPPGVQSPRVSPSRLQPGSNAHTTGLADVRPVTRSAGRRRRFRTEYVHSVRTAGPQGVSVVCGALQRPKCPPGYCPRRQKALRQVRGDQAAGPFLSGRALRNLRQAAGRGPPHAFGPCPCLLSRRKDLRQVPARNTVRKMQSDARQRKRQRKCAACSCGLSRGGRRPFSVA